MTVCTVCGVGVCGSMHGWYAVCAVGGRCARWTAPTVERGGWYAEERNKLTLRRLGTGYLKPTPYAQLLVVS